MNYIEVGKKEGRLIHGGGRATDAGDGYFIQPTVIADIPPMARISQEEIFGPVLAVIKARNFEDALAIANNTEFGLTGAVYSTSRDKLEKARTDFHVGNSVFQSQMHRSHGGRASVWRLQHVRHRLKGRRPGLSAAVYAGKIRGRKNRRCRPG